MQAKQDGIGTSLIVLAIKMNYHIPIEVYGVLLGSVKSMVIIELMTAHFQDF